MEEPRTSPRSRKICAVGAKPCSSLMMMMMMMMVVVVKQQITDSLGNQYQLHATE
jgi:hypothetical protein